MDQHQAHPTARAIFTKDFLPWMLLAALVVVIVILISSAYWRSSAAASQIQVPMFYDAHYLYPRPWTQEQLAPGIPDPAPVALYGSNTIEQTFISGADELARISFWMAGPENSIVTASVSDDRGSSWFKAIPLIAGTSGGEYAIAFPSQSDSKGRPFTLSLSAPGTTSEQPLIVRSVGGDRLGQTLVLNQFSRPGNLAIETYSRGIPGLWWFQALAEQLLPAVFRLRIQQYKIPEFIGAVFSWLFLITACLSAVLLAVASPLQNTSQQGFARNLLRSLAWLLVILAGSFLVWQLVSDRAQIIFNSNEASIEANLPDHGDSAPAKPWIMADLVSDLWTAERYPEPRFVKTDIVAGVPAVRVPGNSELRFAVTVPPDGRLRLAFTTVGEGEVEYDLKINEHSLASATQSNQGKTIDWMEHDLSPWAGQGATLTLKTNRLSGEAEGHWLMPQILTDASWILSDIPEDQDLLAESIRFDESAELLAVEVDDSRMIDQNELIVNLIWRPLQPVDRLGKVFVHLIDDNGQLVAQHDAVPVNGISPFPSWQPGLLIKDEHILRVEGDLSTAPYQLGIGIYDPGSLVRWKARSTGGVEIEEGRFVLDYPVEVQP